MTTSSDPFTPVEPTETWEADTPFAETTLTESSIDRSVQRDQSEEAIGFLPWTESLSPFEEGAKAEAEGNPKEALFAEAFAELRDEAFDEALIDLVAETEQAVEQRFAGESSGTWGSGRDG